MFKWLLLAAALLAPGLAQAAAVQHIQSYTSGAMSCSPCTVSPSPIADGDSVAILVLSYLTNTSIALSDNAGNTYVPQGYVVSPSNSRWAIFTGIGLKRASQLTITFGTAPTNAELYLDEFNYVNGVTDAEVPVQFASSGLYQTVRPHVPNSVVWQVITQGTLPSAPAGFVAGVVDNTGGVETAYGNGPSFVGPITPVWSTSSGGLIASVAFSPSPVAVQGHPR